MSQLEGALADISQNVSDKSNVEEVLRFIQEKFELIPKVPVLTSSVQTSTVTTKVSDVVRPRLTTLIQKLAEPAGGARPKTFLFPTPPQSSNSIPDIGGSKPVPVSDSSHSTFLTSTPKPVAIHSYPVLPKIPCFSGDEPVPKGEVPFVVWRYEVQCLLLNPDLSPSQILQVMRSSLRGTARIMVIPLGQSATTDDILTKLDIMFSDASTKEDLMTEFFNSHQFSSESVTAYACRLETLLQSIITKGQLPGVARNDILRHKLWTGLHSDVLKLQTRHCYDTLQDYNLLLREL